MVMEEQQSTMELASERVPVPQIRKSTKMSRAKTANKSSNAARGKPRFRKKALNAAILKQMEFYFSDANLTKDRFLSNLIKTSPYVDLNVFIQFNKIREHTTSTSRIAKALQGSTMLALSEDGTKVRRVTPIVRKENVDDCTIYVQNLPPDVDHEALIKIFSQYGKVAYVSVPRYKSNKKIKGFAFVEFDTPEDAQKCLECFRTKGCLLPSHTSPNDLLSITTFEDEEKDVTLGKRPSQKQNDFLDQINAEEENMEVSTNENIDNENVENEAKDSYQEDESPNGEEPRKQSKRAKKRRHEESEPTEVGDADAEPADAEVSQKKKKKREKTEQAEISNASAEPADTEVIRSKKRKRKHSENENGEEINEGDAENSKSNEQKEEEMEEGSHAVENQQESDAEQQDADMEVNNGVDQEQDIGEEKKRKRKRTRRSKLEDISYSIGLQIMAKKDWKYLRNKYLELQRTKMKQLKQHLNRARWNQWSNYEKNKSEKEETEEKEKVSKEEVRSFNFIPGVIVKVELNQPCTDPRGFKMELKGNSNIKYIDIEEGSYHAFIRCDTPDAAQALAQKSDDERQMAILQDKEEKLYWDKILQDRADKLGKKVRVKQRGRDKLLKRAEKELGKHIKFDEV